MGINRKFYIAAFDILKERRQNAENAAQQRKKEIYAKFPELEIIEREMSKDAVHVARLTLSGDPDAQQTIAEIAKRNLRLQDDRKSVFEQNGLDLSYLMPNYSCKICSDSGYDKNGKLCSCVRSLAKKMAYDELNKSTPLDKCTFESFNIERYPENARRTMRGIFEFCKNYAYNFNKKSESLMFMGGTGLGKTHLSLAIAGTVTENGGGVIYGSLHSMLSKIENEHFSQNSSYTLDSVCNCDLLIIDDLGAEFSTPFTKSTVYEIINTRLLNSKPVIISTNLDVAEMEKIYSQRIVSRICGCYRCFEFAGEDLRLDG